MSGRSAFRTLVEDFGWIHTGIGLAGNLLFLIGSVAFLPGLGAVPGTEVEWKTVGVWLFIAGAASMSVGSVGALALRIYEAREDKARDGADERRRPAAGRG